MIVGQTETFKKWFKKLKDEQAKACIANRIRYISNNGNLGDFKFIGDKVFELRVHCRAGYRLYFCYQGEAIILLLCGGDKSSQTNDIKKAKQMLKLLK